jgi:hypothetical protein
MSILTVLELKQAIKATFMGDSFAGNKIESHDQEQRDLIAELEAEVKKHERAVEKMLILSLFRDKKNCPPKHINCPPHPNDDCYKCWREYAYNEKDGE